MQRPGPHIMRQRAPRLTTVQQVAGREAISRGPHRPAKRPVGRREGRIFAQPAGQTERFLTKPGSFGQIFGLRMVTGKGPYPRNIYRRPGHSRQPQPKMMIHQIAERRIYPTSLFINGATKEHRRLGQNVQGHQLRQTPRPTTMVMEWTPPGVHRKRIAHHPPRLRMLLQGRDRGSDSPGRVHVVGIQPGQNFPSRPSKSLAQRVGLTLIRFRHPPGQPIRVAPQHFHAAIGGTAVHNNILKARIILAQHRAQGVFQIGRLIVRRRNHTHQRLAHGFIVPQNFSALVQ